MTQLRHLVVVIPGIGGSVLERAGTPVWGEGPIRVARRMFDPEPLSLFSGDGVRAVGLIRPARILPGLTVMHGYGDLIRGICNRFQEVTVDEGHPDHRILDANVVLFPYDFRQSIGVAADRLAAEVNARLKGLSEQDRRRGVIVVAHSMGGLVARHWLGPLQGWPACRALVTLGTPHRGAPKALHWLVNGVRVGGVPLKAATEMIRGWPSVYELLPRYPAVKHEATGKACYPHELDIKGFDSKRAQEAFELHKTMEAAWGEMAAKPRAPEVIAFLGWGHPTLEQAVWTGVLSVTKARSGWLEQPDWFGDGTVPAYAAGPIEQDDRRGGWRRVPVRHGALASLPEVIDLLETIDSGAETPVRGRGPEKRPSLGVDVEESYPAGEKAPVEVFLRMNREESGPDSGVKVWASLSPERAGGSVIDLELEWAGDRWRGAFAGLAPGDYRLRVSATGVAGDEPRPVREVFEVVEP